MKSLKKGLMLNAIKGVVPSGRDPTQLILLSVKGKKDKAFPTPKKQLQIKAYANIIQEGSWIPAQAGSRTWQLWPLILVVE